ncbi:MAG: ribonuclease Y [bacterium]|nr:ribonuclease Y [bacterium]
MLQSLGTSMPLVLIGSGIAIGVVCFCIGYFFRKITSESRIASAKKLAEEIIKEAEKEATVKRESALLEAKEKMLEARTKFEREANERKGKLDSLERRLTERELSLNRRIESFEKREREVLEKEKDITNRERKITEKERQLATLIEEQKRKLEQVSGLTVDQAKKLLLSTLESEVRADAAMLIRSIENEARETAEKKAREIITLAIQKTASDHTAETTVSVVELPNEETKGRIIGREGRNIRALESATGVTLIVDDTPEAVVLSSFDPIRREIAKVALERLINDGRIHPARIEEVVEKVKQEIKNTIHEAGKQAAFEVGIHDLHIELINLLGRLKYRSSYGQNVLQHSKEVAWLAGVMCSELGVESGICKRAGLLHDIGKAVDHEVEGPHAIIGAELAKKYNEKPEVISAILGHHGEVEQQTMESIIVQAADAISSARPGARRETLEGYIKRLEKLEEIADSFSGVAKAYALQAGREIRVIVEPEQVNDVHAAKLARDISKQIEKELQYPGQIKVTVVREVRAVEYAK